MKNINNLVSLAIDNGLEPTRNRLRDDIVSEYTELIDSLPAIEESVVAKNIEMLPVYKINEYKEIEEGFFKKKPKKQYVQPTKEDYNKAISIAKKILFKDPLLKKAYKVIPYKKDGNEIVIMDFSFRDDRLPYMHGDEWNNFLDNIYTETIVKLEEELEKNGIELEVSGTKDGALYIKKFIYSTNESYIDEGYAIELDTLKYVVESKECTLEEAVQEIRDVNYIGDTYPMYCVLPEKVNGNVSIESFVTLNESLIKAEIIPVSTRVFDDEEFLTEASKLENLKEDKLRKNLQTYEKNLEELKKKKSEFVEMSLEEQRKYCLKKATKNLIIGTLVSLPTMYIGGVVYNTYITMKGDNTILGPKNYKQQLNNLIAAYNIDIRRMKKRLKELEAKK